MHQLLQHRVDGVAALRARANIATAAFYALIGKDQPVQEIRLPGSNQGQRVSHR